LQLREVLIVSCDYSRFFTLFMNLYHHLYPQPRPKTQAFLVRFRSSLV